MSETHKRRVALITGAARGIGAAVAVALARDGFDLFLTCRSHTERIDQVAEDCRALGAFVYIMSADLSVSSSAKTLCDAAIEKFGFVDVLVNNAGITRDGLLVRMREEQWDEVIATDLSGVYHLTRQISPYMFRKRSGKIINIASVAGISGNAGQVNYSAAKAGVIGLTKAAAKELGNRGVTVNAVAPGLIETDMTEALTEEHADEILARVSLGRLGKPEEVADLVAYLASPKADYITGQTFVIDGGLAL